MIILAIAILVLFFGGAIYGLIVEEEFREVVLIILAFVAIGISLASAALAIAWALDYTINYFNLIK